MELTVSVSEYADDVPVKNVWRQFYSKLRETEGIAYYKHPNIGAAGGRAPDLAILPRNYQPIIVVTRGYSIDEISDVDNATWTISDKEEDSPVEQVRDYIVSITGKFEKTRQIRGKFLPVGALVLPNIRRRDFQKKFAEFLASYKELFIFGSEDSSNVLKKLVPDLSEREWEIAVSVFQSAAPLTQFSYSLPKKSDKMGLAIKEMEKRIGQLDDIQNKVAIQTPPGPQRVRGLAGTGKTVLLAMRAANIHARYPQAKILFTFHTTSLYGQVQRLITQFYRFNNDNDPDWEYVHIRHGWGGKNRSGVYTDLCSRQNSVPIDLRKARNEDREIPFRAACKDALSREIVPTYDYILVDEAQDFPFEFFRVLYKLAISERKIYWAYDSLQSLSSLEIPGPDILFGNDAEGRPLVNLEGFYGGEIEKDLILRKSYRCPREVLMFAHAIGLGLYRDGGCVQILKSSDDWMAVGYEIVDGIFEKGNKVTVERPKDSSPLETTGVYEGPQSSVTFLKPFTDRETKLDWVAERIEKDIKEEQVAPEQIVVITLDPPHFKSLFRRLYQKLLEKQILCTVPGLYDDTAEFASKGNVTLTTPFRAKGNEASIIYIISFDSLYDYGDEITNRNAAFTSISRSKGWVRITGTGDGMVKGYVELNKIQELLPKFEFIYPDPEHIRFLDTESNRRKVELNRAEKAINILLKTDFDAVDSVIEKTGILEPEDRKKLKDLLKKVRDEN